MSIISEALLEQLMNDGVPIFIIPENLFKKKKKTIKDSLETSNSLSRTIKIGESVIPSPVPG